MPKGTRDYGSWLSGRLADPTIAMNYLNAALVESQALFLKALRKVSEAHRMARVAEEAGVSRESLYRMLSASGNPTLASLNQILKAIGYRIVITHDIIGAERQPGLESLRFEADAANNKVLGAQGTIAAPASSQGAVTANLSTANANTPAFTPAWARMIPAGILPRGGGDSQRTNNYARR